MSGTISIRPIEAGDRAAWEPLWQGYLRFYRAHLAPEVTEFTWSRLIDPKRQPHGLVAVRDGRIIGITHYLFHPSSWTKEDQCYLQDLFVDPNVRGSGAGRALIEAVYEAAERHGTPYVHWLTQEFNADARALYDTLARRTSFIQYRRMVK
ncbi:MAG TPA: GNAT family N-acetyltransferase [Micropepsaceae bacterium]|nr:GNAT family N-acetyltransferase [Micropepsaceae bacterium]